MKHLTEIFQSTRPVRGATIDRRAAGKAAVGISIHAPRAGRDNLMIGVYHILSYFNPRAPCGARPGKDSIVLGKLCISIHAPRAGRDAF